MTVRKSAHRAKEGLNHVKEIANTTVRDHLNITKKMVPPSHPKRKDKAAVNMPKSVGGIAKQVKDNCRILHIPHPPQRKLLTFLKRLQRLKQEWQKIPARTRQTNGKNMVWFREIERKLVILSKTTFTYRSSS